VNNFTKKAPWHFNPSRTQNWIEVVKDLQTEELDLIETLSAIEATRSDKIIDNGEPRSTLHYEEALRRRLAEIHDALVRIGH
jgi:hypothetical protein